MLLSKTTKRLLSMILVVVFMVFSTAAYADTNTNVNVNVQVSFKDVPTNYWAYDSIQAMANKGIISGYSNGNFAPTDPITREQFAKILTLTYGLDPLKPSTPTFSDVTPASWSYGYVEAAKEYMTGYFPPKGKPFFDPAGYATREDIAVALVRASGLDTDNIDGLSILQSKFWDYESVSPQLANEVAVAVQNNLIKGLPDGSFAGDNPIDRASAATLLYRVLKSSFVNASKDIVLEISLPDKVASSKLNISGKVSSGARLYINDEECTVASTGKFNEAYTLEDGEGLYEFTFKVVMPNGRSKVVKKQVTYEIGAPKLTVNFPQDISKANIKLTGKVTDESDAYPVLTINGEEVYVSYNGDWSKEITLKDGSNKFVIVAQNKFEKKTVIEKELVFSAGAPELVFLEPIPDSVTAKELKVKCWVKDKNDSSPKVYLNDKLLYDYYWDGDYKVYSATVSLSEGTNNLVFKVLNKLGKSTTAAKTVNFSVGAPELAFREAIPETVASKTLTVKCWVKDANDSNPKLYLNEKQLYSYTWDGDYKVYYTDVTLAEGSNALVFKAVNNLGKSTVMQKSVSFTVSGPEILFREDVPTTVNKKELTVKCWVKDSNDSSPKLYCNDTQEYDYSWDGDYKVYYVDANLKEGSNTLTFKATNNLNKSTTVTKTVNFVVPGPNIEVNVPSTTNVNNIKLEGKINDNTYSYDKLNLTINGRVVPIGYYGSWSYTLELNEGQNMITMIATNPSGKQTKIEKTIMFQIVPPTIEVNVPATSNALTIDVTGTVKDEMDSKPSLTINGEAVTLSWGQFSKKITLVEGPNTITFVATSAVTGKTTKIERVINVTLLPPTLNVSVPETATTDTVQISGNVCDLLDSAVVVKVNGQAVTVNSSGNWNYTLKLAAGANEVKIEATNKYGKTTTVTKTITYTPAP